MTADTTFNTNGPDHKPPPWRFGSASRLVCGGVLVAALVVGAAAGAGITRHIQRSHPQAVLLLQPAPIAKLTNFTPVAVKGEVAESFGGKFIIQDESGRTLVDTGPRGEKTAPAAKGETVTIQGHFANGIIHADVIVHADGRSEGFGPPRPRPGHGPGFGPRGERGPGFGPDHRPGPDRGPGSDRGPPPSPPAP